MPEVATLAAIKPHISDLENTIGITINKVQVMSGGDYILSFAAEQIQQLAKKNNTTNSIAFDNLIKLLQARNDVQFAVLDRIITLDPREMKAINISVTPSHDKQWDEQIPENSTPAKPSWGVNLDNAWNITKGDNVVVAVVDSGIASNKALNANVLPGYNFYDNNTDPTDPGGESDYHGTHVAGTIAANGDIFGMAPNAKIVPILVLKPKASDDQIIDGMNWAVNIHADGVPDNKNIAHVINLSLGGSAPSCSQAYQDAINNIRAKGATIVIAAGNENMDASKSSPGNCANVITVAATNARGIRAPYSNYGSLVTLAAPGGMTPFGITSVTGILSTIKDDFVYYEGTSMAAPHIAGIVALMYAIRIKNQKTTTPDQIKSWLTSSAHKFASYPETIEFNCVGTKTCGAGLVDALAAVKAAQAAP